MKKNSTLVILALIIGVLLMYREYREVTADYKEIVLLNTIANEELVSWKDKDGNNRSRIDILETESTKAFLAYESKDSMVRRLQEQVKDMKKYLKQEGSVTVVEGETNYVEETKKEVATPLDSLYTSFIQDSVKNSWITSSFGFKLDTLPDGKAYIDSVKYSLKVKNVYSLVIGREPTGFLGLGKGKPFAEIKNMNPYSEVQNMKTYQVRQPARNRFSIGLYSGYGATTQSSKVVVGWQVGVGITYSLIEF